MKYLSSFLLSIIVSGLAYFTFRFLWSDVSDRTLLCIVGATIIGFLACTKEASND